MKTAYIDNKFEISRVGIGGHYKGSEEGEFEYNYARVGQEEVRERAQLVEKAVANGITYFDTTWRNEVEMLSRTLQETGLRDKVFVNGMVLGAFVGSAEYGQSVGAYFTKWLDDRLAMMPGHRFDSFMINAIEQGYDTEKCAQLMETLKKRQAMGDIGVIGFSCHNQFIAREIADAFPDFKLIMLPYNYHNRKFEAAFETYTGTAAIVAMKPLVWAQYGVPFVALHDVRDFEKHFNFTPDPAIVEKAISYILAHKSVTTTVCAVNSMEELDALLAAGNRDFTGDDDKILAKYSALQAVENGIPLFIGGTKGRNLRKNKCALESLSEALGIAYPDLRLNEQDAEQQLQSAITNALTAAADQGYEKYI